MWAAYQYFICQQPIHHLYVSTLSFMCQKSIIYTSIAYHLFQQPIIYMSVASFMYNSVAYQLFVGWQLANSQKRGCSTQLPATVQWLLSSHLNALLKNYEILKWNFYNISNFTCTYLCLPNMTGELIFLFCIFSWWPNFASTKLQEY